MPERSAVSAGTLPQADRVSVLAKVPLALQWGMPLLCWTIQVSQGNMGRGPEGRFPLQSGKNTIEDPSHKWVINLSHKPLTQAQRSLLAKGSNYAKAPRYPPNIKHITAIESVYTQLSQQDVEEIVADINRVLRGPHPPGLILGRQKHRL